MKPLLLLATFLALASTGQAGLVVGINDPRFAQSYPAATLNTLNVDQVAIGVSAGDAKPWAIPSNMDVLVILGGDHWYELHPHEYAAAALRLVRAHPNVRELQVWNEPDLCSAWGWTVCLTTPDLRHRFASAALDYYLNELAATHDALAGTGVKVLGFGFSPPFRRKGTQTYSWWSPEEIARGIDSWYARRGGRHCVGVEAGECISVRGVRYARPIMDGFAYHPYNGWDAAETNRIHDALASLDLPGGTPSLWWTEFGMDTAWVHRCNCDWQGSESEEATRVGDVLRAAQASSYVAGAFNFLLRDEGNASGFQSGLLRPDGSVKPAFAAFERAA